MDNRKTTILLLFLSGVILCSCGWNLNATNGDGGTDPDTTAIFKNVTSSNLPESPDATSSKAKAADIDNDGDLDIIVAVSFSQNKILLNDGSGKFTDASSRLPQLNYDSHDVTVADLNSDGNLDLFFVGNQNQTNELYINNGGGTFSDLANRIPVSGNSTSVEALDIDGDGPVDILIGNIGQNVLLMNSGNAFFNNQTLQRLPQISDPTYDIALADLTGDNLREIVVGNETANRLLVNTGSGFFSDQTSNRIPFTNDIEETQDVNIADVDGDGDRDIYFGNTGFQEGSNPQDRLLINTGQGFFTDLTSDRLPAITTFTYDAEFADLDNDGDWDLVVGNYDGGLRVLVNNGNGFFSDNTAAWIPENFAPYVLDLEVADFNNDKLMDIYIAVDNGKNQLLIQRKQ